MENMTSSSFMENFATSAVVFTEEMLLSDPTLSTGNQHSSMTPLEEVRDMTYDMMNQTDYDYEFEYFTRPTWWLVILCVIYGTLIIVAVVGNIFVIVAYHRDIRIKRSVANTFILNLAIADLIVGAFTWPIYVAWLIIGPWIFGEYMCKIWSVIDYTVTAMSVITIILISLDRYWLLTKTTGYVTYQTQRRANITIATCWGVVLSIYILLTFWFAYFTNYYPVDFNYYCDMEFIYTLPALVTTIILNFAVPAVIIIILNATVYYKIRQRAKGLDKLQNKIKYESGMKEKQSESGFGKRIFRRKKEYPSKGGVVQGLDPGVFLVTVSSLNTEEYHQNPAFVKFEVTPPSSDETSGIASGHEQDDAEFSDGNDETKDQHASNSNRLNVYAISKETNKTEHTNQSSPTGGKRSKIDGLKKMFKRKQREFKRERKAAFILAVLVTVFILCWLPFQITVIIAFICNFECVPEIAFIIAENLVWANSALNPILYAATNVHFRRNFLCFMGLKKLARNMDDHTSGL